jgi:hypothetical protein
MILYVTIWKQISSNTIKFKKKIQKIIKKYIVLSGLYVKFGFIQMDNKNKFIN